MDLRQLPIEPSPEAREWRAQHRRGAIPKIWRDRYLKAFVEEHMTKMPFAKLAALCAETFGKPRAPGISTLHRYFHFSMNFRYPSRLPKAVAEKRP